MICQKLYSQNSLINEFLDHAIWYTSCNWMSNSLGFWPGLTQTCLYSNLSRLEISDLERRDFVLARGLKQRHWSAVQLLQGTDQLHSYCTADLHLHFGMWENPFFFLTRLIYFSAITYAGTGVSSGDDRVSDVDATLNASWDCCCCCSLRTSSTILKIWLIFIDDDGLLLPVNAAFNRWNIFITKTCPCNIQRFLTL